MTREKAKQRIQKYVNDGGHKKVHITEGRILFWWKVLNSAVFDGKVTLPYEIEIMPSTTEVFAYAVPFIDKRIKLLMQNQFHQRTTFLTVLVHEMVHAWEYQTYQQMAHGKRFFSWREAIHEHTSLDLQREISEYEHTRKINRDKTGLVGGHGSKTAKRSTRADNG